MWELDCEESWVPKNWRFWTVVLEKNLESPLDCKEIQPVHPKGDQSWVFIGRTDVEPETPILWPPHGKSWLMGKDPNAGKDWGQEEKGTTEDEMDGWHHRHNGHGFVWTPGVSDGQEGLACCNSWGRKESDTIERLNWTESAPVLCGPTHSGPSHLSSLQCREVVSHPQQQPPLNGWGTPPVVLFPLAHHFSSTFLLRSRDHHCPTRVSPQQLRRLLLLLLFSQILLFWPHGLRMPGFPVLHCLLEFAETHEHRLSDAI